MNVRDPDAAVVATFRHHAMPNPARSKQEGRLICDDMEVCDIRFAGSRAMSTFPATAISHWINDPENPYSGEQTPVTYAERFKRQYQQFKGQTQQTKAGTPLTHVPFLTEARRAELRALNIYTVEALASVDGQELKNLGANGRELKNQAMTYMDESRVAAPNKAMQSELEEMRARNVVLEEDAKALRERLDAEDKDGESTFDGMSLDQLRDYIKQATGHMPLGAMNRKTLVRMATEAQKQKAA
jgi:hypothetical protein